MVAAIAVHLVALLRRYGPVLVAGLCIVLVFSCRQQLAGMDERFFQSSFKGTIGLGYYLIGDYTKAARAYRAHFKEEAEAGHSSEDPVEDAMLRRDLRKARLENEKRLAQQPDDTGLLVTAGEIELEDDRPIETLQILSPVLQRDPYNRDALLLAASAHARTQSFDLAINDLKTALRVSSRGSWDRGFLLSLETAGMVKDVTSERKPVCLLAHYYRYLRIFDRSNARSAIHTAWRAIDAGDRPDDAYLTIGVVLVKQGEAEAALAPILKAIEVNPRNAAAYRWAAALYANRSGDLQNEFLMWKGAFGSDPDDRYTINRFVQFLVSRFGDYPQALRIGRAGLERHPDDVQLSKEVARIYFQLGEYDQAIEESRRLLVTHPKDVEAHNFIGSTYARKGKYEEGIAAFQAALSIDPSNAHSHAGLGGIYYRRRNREAIREYEIAFRSGYADLDAENALCALYLWESEYRKAEECFAHVLRQNPENKSAQHLYSYVLSNLQR